MNLRSLSRQTVLLLILLLPGAVWGQAQLLQERWVRVDTENFHLISQLNSRQTLRFANMLETWRRVAAYTISSNNQQNYPPANVPNYVYLFENLETYQMFTFATEAGFFTPSPRANFMAFIAGEEDSSAIAFHHYVHFLVRNFADLRLPRWYEEGLAGYIARMRIDGDEAVFDRYSAESHELMISISEQLSMDRLLFREEALASPRVIQIANLKSETLLHYILHAYEEDGFTDRRAQLSRYLELLLEGRNPRFAYDQAFHVSPAQLDEEFHAYLATSRRPRGTINTGTLASTVEYTSEPLAGAPLAIQLAELALNSGRFENAQLLFQAAQDSGQEIARSYSGLGDALRMQELDGMDQQITRYFEQALALAPEDPNIQLDYGEYWETELLDCDNDWPPAQRSRILNDMQQQFSRAVAQVPASPEANLAMGQLHLIPEMDWQPGLEYQRKAFELLPADTFILEQSVKYAIAAGDFAEAERLINELAQPIHFWGEPGWVTDLRERLLSKRNNSTYDACADE